MSLSNLLHIAGEEKRAHGVQQVVFCAVDKQFAARRSLWIRVEVEVGPSIHLHRQHLPPQHRRAFAFALHIQSNCFRIHSKNGQRQHMAPLSDLSCAFEPGCCNSSDDVTRHVLGTLRRAHDEDIGQSSVGQLLRHKVHINGRQGGGGRLR